MDSIEQIFEQACKKLEQGCSKAEVLSLWPDLAKELEPLLDTASLFYSLPKKDIPEPAMQRKYILVPAKRLWLHWIRVSRFAAVSTSVLLLGALLSGTGYAASRSVPGQILFSLKKTAEHLQLQLASNPQEKLNLQIKIAQERLNDAQTVVNSQERDPQKEVAALNELASETKNTAEVLDQATKDKTTSLIATKDHPLIASLNTITSQQQKLLKNLGAQNQTIVNKSVLDAAQANVTKVAEIKNYLEAASNEQAIASLQSNPEAITATGTIDRLTSGTVTVGSETFNLNDQTIIISSTNTPLKPQNLSLQQQVKILGDKNDSGLVARQIMILAKTTPESSQESSVGSTKPVSKKLIGSATTTQDNQASVQAAPNPNTAIGTFIMEDPAPQTDYNK